MPTRRSKSFTLSPGNLEGEKKKRKKEKVLLNERTYLLNNPHRTNIWHRFRAGALYAARGAFFLFFLPPRPHSVRSELTQPCALMFQLTAINPGLVQGWRRKEIMETQQRSSLCFACCFCLLRAAFTTGWQSSAVSWLGGTADPRYGLADAGSVWEKGWRAGGMQYGTIKYSRACFPLRVYFMGKMLHTRVDGGSSTNLNSISHSSLQR